MATQRAGMLRRESKQRVGGFLYTCDFNQAIGLPITGGDGEILKIEDLESAAKAARNPCLPSIATAVLRGKDQVAQGLISRLGVQYGHLSNGDTHDSNPIEQEALITFEIPF